MDTITSPTDDRPQALSPARAAPRLRSALRIVMVALLLLGSLVITSGSFAYFDDEVWPEFVIEKLPLATEALEAWWLQALPVHVVAAALALPGCLFLVSQTVIRRFPRLHRYVGRVIGLVVLFALAPSGLFMAFFAKGGAAGTAGFVASGAIVVVAMVMGVVTARRKRFVAHRRHVWHVLAQLSVAVSSRAMLVALDAAGVDAELAYLVSLWLPVVGSALMVEVLLPRPGFAQLPRRIYVALRRRLALPALQPRLARD